MYLYNFLSMTQQSDLLNVPELLSVHPAVLVYWDLDQVPPTNA